MNLEKRGGRKRKTPWANTPVMSMHIMEQTHRRATGVRPQGSSDQVRGFQPYGTRRHKAQTPDPNPPFYVSSSKTKSGTSPRDQSPSFSSPLSTNHIVRDLSCASPTPLLGRRRNCVLTIGAVCGKSMRVGAGGGGVNSLVSKDSRSFLRLQ